MLWVELEIRQSLEIRQKVNSTEFLKLNASLKGAQDLRTILKCSNSSTLPFYWNYS